MCYENKSNAELLSMVLGVSENTFRLNDLEQVVRAPRSIYGVGTKKAEQLQAIGELATRLMEAENRSRKRVAISGPADVAEYAGKRLRYENKEHFCIVILNTKNHIIDMPIISVGSQSSSVVHPREVFKTAIEASASSIILVHNHPSGDSEPSHDDVTVTKRLVKCGELLQIPVLDHIVIGDDEYCSFKEHGLI